MAPNTGTVELVGRQPRSTGSGQGCLILFSLPFMGTGVGIPLLYRAHPEGANAPPYVIDGFAAIFFIAGFLVFISAVRGLMRRSRDKRRRLENPLEPWLGDHSWNREGEREHPYAKALHGMFGPGFFALFLAPFNWWAYTSGHFMVIAIVGLFDLILLGGVGFWLYELARALKYGATWIRYDRFPFYLGDTLSVRLGCRGRLDRFDKVVVTLRFIRETWETRSDSNTAVLYQRWADEKEFSGEYLRNAAELPIAFALPTGDYATCLSDKSARYWEIEMKGDAPGIDFLARFIVPVYGRS